MDPIAYFSKALKPAETRYSTFDRELLAVYLAVKHFRHFLEGREFFILTDHRPLTYALTSSSADYTPRQIRHLDLISQFTSDIRYLKGSDNGAADALSRMEVSAFHVVQQPGVDLVSMTAMQLTDLELQHLMDDTSSRSTSLVLKAMPLPMSESTIICDVSTGTPCPFVSTTFCF